MSADNIHKLWSMSYKDHEVVFSLDDIGYYIFEVKCNDGGLLRRFENVSVCDGLVNSVTFIDNATSL